jgi:hypothetical protein
LPQHAELCERGRQFRAQLPSYRTWSNRGHKSLLTVLCLTCSILSWSPTPRPLRRTCGRTGCSSEPNP